jgi:hypothetical protein
MLSQMNQQQTDSSKDEGQSVVQTSSEADVAPKSKEKPIDKLEKESQPLDNDDDEKLADNHRKMAKIVLK